MRKADLDRRMQIPSNALLQSLHCKALHNAVRCLGLYLHLLAKGHALACLSCWLVSLLDLRPTLMDNSSDIMVRQGPKDIMIQKIQDWTCAGIAVAEPCTEKTKGPPHRYISSPKHHWTLEVWFFGMIGDLKFMICWQTMHFTYTLSLTAEHLVPECQKYQGYHFWTYSAHMYQLVEDKQVQPLSDKVFERLG